MFDVGQFVRHHGCELLNYIISGMAGPVLRTGSVVPNSEPVPKLEPWFPENGTGSTYFPIFIDFRLKITFKLHLRTILIMKGCTNGTTLH